MLWDEPGTTGEDSGLLLRWPGPVEAVEEGASVGVALFVGGPAGSAPALQEGGGGRHASRLALPPSGEVRVAEEVDDG